jgi:hypothetical protein
MLTVDKIQKLASGQILFLDADNNIVRSTGDVCKIDNITDVGFNVYEQGKMVTVIKAANITRLEYYPNAETPAALSSQDLALELATNFFRG